jgi:hypothetical protein
MPEWVEVGCYAGDRGDETPRVVLLGGREVTLWVERRWLEEWLVGEAASAAAGCSRSSWRMAAVAAWRRSRMVHGDSLSLAARAGPATVPPGSIAADGCPTGHRRITKVTGTSLRTDTALPCRCQGVAHGGIG